MPWRPTFTLPNNEIGRNAQVFETKQEALDSAMDRYRVWTVPIAFGTEMCEGPVNHIRVDGRDERKVNDY